MIKIQHQKKKKKKVFENRTGKLLRLSLSSIKVRAIRPTASLKKTRK